MKNLPVRLIFVLLLAAGIVGGLYWWQQKQQQPAAVATAPPAPTPPADAAPETPPPAPAEPAVKYPIEPLAKAPETPEQPAIAPPATLDEAANAWAGKQNALSQLVVDGVAGRVVATVDNLGRPHVAPRVWPVHPTAGRFTVEQTDAGPVLADENAARYTAFVKMVQGLDTPQGVAFYTQFYPQFQQAYEELGYPGQYFNDRLVAVIDELLATPEVEGPLLLELPEIKDPGADTRPWVRYQYADPALQSLSSGQKMLLRMGPENRQALKLKLREIREAVTRGALVRQ